jgi:hypothetical protein
MKKALTITSFYLVVIMLSVYMINVYGLGDSDNDGFMTKVSLIAKDGGCDALKHKLNHLADAAIDEKDNKTNITKQSQQMLSILHDYVSECD